MLMMFSGNTLGAIVATYRSMRDFFPSEKQITTFQSTFIQKNILDFKETGRFKIMER